MDYFSIFLKKLTSHALIFSRLDEKHKLFEILRKYSKILKRFLKKIAKAHYFSIFFKKFNK